MPKLSKGPSRLITIILFIVVLLAIIGNIYNFTRKSNKATPLPPNIVKNGTLLSTPRVITPFHLVDNHGKSFTKASLKGRWTLMFFGFTNCGYVCPTTMAELSKMYQSLASQVPEREMPQVVLVSVDPKRDSVSRLNEYVTSFHKDFKGARGDAKDIENLTKQMSVVYIKLNSPKDKDHYTINHSGAIMLMDPNGNLSAFFSTPHKAKEMVIDYKSIMKVMEGRI